MVLLLMHHALATVALHVRGLVVHLNLVKKQSTVNAVIRAMGLTLRPCMDPTLRPSNGLDCPCRNIFNVSWRSQAAMYDGKAAAQPVLWDIAPSRASYRSCPRKTIV